MDDLAFDRNATDHGSATRNKSALADLGIPLRVDREQCDVAIYVVSAEGDPARSGPTQPLGSPDERVEHRLQIERRAADDLQHIARRGLVFERLLQVVRAILQFVQEPRIFDRDYRLVGEAFDQPDLFVREGPNFLTIDVDGADQLFALEHWDREYGSITAQL